MHATKIIRLISGIAILIGLLLIVAPSTLSVSGSIGLPMDTVLLGTVVLFVLMNMVATIYFYTLREEEKTVGSIEPKTVEESNPKEDTTEVIECPHCGARNEFGYKYCQNCINELPGSYISSGSKNPITGGLSL